MTKKNMPALATRLGAAALTVGSMLAAAVPATAEEWSDTALSWRYGTHFSEPYNDNNITKNIVGLTHIGGYKYGTNFFSVDLLMSNDKDPADAGPPPSGEAQEAYVIYRNTIDLSKVTHEEYKFGVVKGVGATFGFDWNTKNDCCYDSKKRMAVLGPTLMIDVPGFLNVSVLELWESNYPTGTTSRYEYKPHPMLTANWGIPIGDSAFSFEGFVNYIAAKGTDEFGNGTMPETNFDGSIMLDVGRVTGGAKNTFKVGFEYQWWRNKFGNDASLPGDGGAFSHTPMVRAEYHF